jgi:hypothetical protein
LTSDERGVRLRRYPKLWVSKNGERKGYMPACANDGVYAIKAFIITPKVNRFM